jgi:FkbM family methyltransferase
MTSDSPLTSYAQNFEDVLLWRALQKVEAGFYIDIGAQDPVEDSVSLGFYEKGWRGVHVEPTQHYADRLRAARPDETVLQAAIAGDGGLLTFFEIAETGLSTADRANAETHRRAGFDVRETMVPTARLGSLLERYADRAIHWLKIDVEGLEGEVIESWGDCQVRPWLLVIESTLPGTQIDSGHVWEASLSARGYRSVYFDGLNRFYLHETHPELAAFFQSGPNCFDNVVLSGTSTSRMCRLLTDRIGAIRHQLKETEQAGEARLQEIQALLDKTRQELAARHRDLTHFKGEAQIFRDRLDDLYKTYISDQQAAVMERDLLHQTLSAALHQAQQERDRLLASFSWRVTRPVRFLSRLARRGIRGLARLPTAPRRLMARGLGFVRARPALKRRMIVIIDLVPGLGARVRKVIDHRPGQMAAAPLGTRLPPLDLTALPATARRLQTRLLLAQDEEQRRTAS